METLKGIKATIELESNAAPKFHTAVWELKKNEISTWSAVEGLHPNCPRERPSYPQYNIHCPTWKTDSLLSPEGTFLKD